MKLLLLLLLCLTGCAPYDRQPTPLEVAAYREEAQKATGDWGKP